MPSLVLQGLWELRKDTTPLGLSFPTVPISWACSSLEWILTRVEDIPDAH